MSFEIVPPGTRIDFIGKRRAAAALSLGLILASLIAIPIRGVRLGIDFAGGNEVQVRFDETVVVDEGQIREVLSSTEVVSDPTVMRFGTGETQEYLIKFLSNEESASALPSEDAEASGGSGNLVTPGKADQAQRLEAALREGIGPLEVQRVEFVGPRVGAELQSDGLLSLFWASLAILAYVAFRFSSRFAPGPWWR